MNYRSVIHMRLIAIFILCLITMPYLRSQTSVDGWEFLTWKMKEDEVEKEISKQTGIERGSMLDASFDFNGMSAWLGYNENKELVNVTQKETFSIIDDKEAEIFYNERMVYMTGEYGNPVYKKHDRKNDNIIVKWEFAHTLITLEYDYKYKVIDEFGAGSYWVEILYEYR